MKKEITLKVKPGKWGELANVAEDIRGLERELWAGRRMGECAMALSLDAYADRIEVALGIRPRPKGVPAAEVADAAKPIDPSAPEMAKADGIPMDAANPRPWTVRPVKFRRGRKHDEYADVLDARGFFVAQGLNVETAKMIVFAVNAYPPAVYFTPEAVLQNPPFTTKEKP